MRKLVLVGATAVVVLAAVPAPNVARTDANKPASSDSGKLKLEKRLDLSRYRAGFHYVIDASSAGSLLAQVGFHRAVQS